MRIPISVIALFYCCLTTSAQRGNNWVFGNKAWLNFSTTPLSLGTSAMSQPEGSSSISDMNGNLIFYSDGVKVWNAQHQVMPNGTGLFGHFSSTQSSMIVPFPGDPIRYYLFTMDVGGGVHGLSYSVVNMNLDNGKGDIELKNQFLVGPSVEKVTSVNHCNGKDVWIMTATATATMGKLHAYLITATGINPPVISTVTGAAPYFNIGYLKFSPDGRKLASASVGIGLDLYDFDAATGLVTNRKSILNGNNQQTYGIEFSPNSKLMYISNAVRTPPSAARFDVSQYDQLDASASTIISTRLELTNYFLGNVPVGFVWFSALQVAPNGKIYVSLLGGSIVEVINNPDRQGIACNYSSTGITLLPGTNCIFGLPDFNQSYFKASFSYNTSCSSKQVKFYFTIPNDASAIKWDFGDPPSGVDNTSVIDSPIHVFSSPGTYEVKVIAYLQCRNDTMRKTVTVDPVLVTLGADKITCENTAYILTPQTQGTVSYRWQDNSTNTTYPATMSGLYWVEIKSTISGCIARDSIQLTYNLKPVVDLGIDTSICERTTFLLDAGNPGAIYTWQDNSSNQTFLVKEAGTYFVNVKQNGCENSDTIVIQPKYIPTVSLGNDTAICDGMSIQLIPFLNHANNASFLWNTGETQSSIAVTAPGSYSLSVSNLCGTVADGIVVKKGVCKLYVPTAFTPNNDGKNDVFKPGYGENVISYSMEIYNRWGERIFESKRLSNGWDGKLKGVLQPAGMFVWLIRYKVFNDPKEYFLKGTLALIY